MNIQKNDYVATETDRKLIHLLMGVYRNVEFVESMWVNLETEKNRAKMVIWLEKNKDINRVEAIEQMLEITMKGDLVEHQFKKLNPNIKL